MKLPRLILRQSFRNLNKFVLTRMCFKQDVGLVCFAVGIITRK